MVIAPVAFCAVVAGIASMRDMKAVGRAGGKALLYFELVSSVALGFGLLMGHLLHPGAGFNVSVASLDASAVSGYVSRAAHGEGVAGFLMQVIPETFVGAFTHDEILPVLLIAMLCGSALSVLGERVRPVVEGVAAMMFRIVGFITRVAPLGAIGAIAFTVGRFGVGSLLPMFKLVACFYLSAALFVFVVLGAVARLACPLGRSPRQVSGWLAPTSAAWSPAPPPAASLEIVAETRCSTSVPERRGLRLFSTWWKSRICWRHARNGKRCRLHGSGRLEATEREAIEQILAMHDRQLLSVASLRYPDAQERLKQLAEAGRAAIPDQSQRRRNHKVFPPLQSFFRRPLTS
ncbi:hypothetical protein Bpla01_57180 [Burkholderia plantarii]|nr:Na+/H+-dicarboxylate symporter [Burkholderia plantarii]GLZ22189.1 hypothetical protein Bpla01_57180 [Burkholderia plantarii]